MSEVAERIRHTLARSRHNHKQVATLLGISERHLTQIAEGQCSVSPFVALGLERVLGMSAQMLLYAQVNEELAKARAEFATVLKRW